MVWGGDVWKRGEPERVFKGCLQQELHFTGALTQAVGRKIYLPWTL